MRKLILTKQSLIGEGLEITVKGCIGDPADPDNTTVFIENHEGQILIHVWNGEQNPTTTVLKEYRF